MTPLVGLLFLLGVVAIILTSGYWITTWDLASNEAERPALAALAGLTSLLLMVSLVNALRPLSGVWAALCLLPAAITLLRARSRRHLLGDFILLIRSGSSLRLVVSAAVFIVLLLISSIIDRQALFYDGTTNHDSFIWITSGESLQHHAYLEPIVQHEIQPGMNMAQDNVGWQPRRAQLGAETLLALFASLAGTTPLHICLYLAAALFLPWMAAVYLAVTTFFRSRLSSWTAVALILLQPVFVFFFANSNLPNLLGAMTGATVVIALTRALRAETGLRCLRWCVLLALGFHGLIAVYPEMIPFIGLCCALLWLRPWFERRWEIVRRNGSWTAGAVVLGAVLNPVVTVRAVHGFRYSFETARADVIFANLLAPLNAAEHVPGLVTLAIPAMLKLGTIAGVILTAVILVGVALAWWKARDRVGALFTLAGSAALLVYTISTGFNYGWQKTAQFGAISLVAFTTAPLWEALAERWRERGGLRWLAGLGLVCALVFHAFATVSNLGQIREWSRQKMISQDWFQLRELSETTLREKPVLVESASFRMPFFHSMWAPYFLSESHSYFARRGGEGGGYLRLGVLNESAVPGGKPAAYLVGRRWADSFDANSPRLLTGREFVLFRELNRITDEKGVYPLNGFPDNASARFSFEITPHSASQLRLTLAPHRKPRWPEASWEIVHRDAAGKETMTQLSGPPPWQIDVPLIPQVLQTVECRVVSPTEITEEFPFAIRQLTVESTP